MQSVFLRYRFSSESPRTSEVGRKTFANFSSNLLQTVTGKKRFFIGEHFRKKSPSR
jgi:hypothetical protein